MRFPIDGKSELLSDTILYAGYPLTIVSGAHLAADVLIKLFLRCHYNEPVNYGTSKGLTSSTTTKASPAIHNMQ